MEFMTKTVFVIKKMIKKKKSGLRFRRRSEHVVDAQGYLNIPSQFRGGLS